MKKHFKALPFAQKGVILFALLLLSLPLVAQSDGTPYRRYHWYSVGVGSRIGQHWRLSVSRQYSVDPEKNASLKYYQDDIRLTFRFHKRWELLGGWTYLVNDPSDDQPAVKQRASLGLGWRKSRQGWAFGTRLIGERHFQETRYDGRFVWTNRLAYSRIRLFHRVRVQPWVSGQLYYFLGGSWIRQYDESGELVGRRPTYGFHRIRMRGGLSIRPLSWLEFNIGYLHQTEFNTPHAYRFHHQIHEVNPGTGKVSRSFQNYQAWTTGITFLLGGRKPEETPAAVFSDSN